MESLEHKRAGGTGVAGAGGDPPLGLQENLETRIRRQVATASRACLLLAPAEAPVEGVPTGDLEKNEEPGDSAAALEWLATQGPSVVADAQAATDAGLHSLSWQLAMSLSPLQAHYFQFTVWAELSHIAVTAAERAANPAALAAALDNRGRYLFRRRMLEQARECHARALDLRRAAGDRRGTCRSLNALGLVCLRERDLAQASTYFTDAERTAVSAGEERFAALARMNLAESLLDAGRDREALDVLRPLPALFANWQDSSYEGNAWWLLSWARRASGDPAGAFAAIGAALRIADGTANSVQRAHWLAEAARVHLALGDTGQAAACGREAAALQREIGDESREATALDITGDAALAAGDAISAAALCREAAAAHQRLGDLWQEALATARGADAEESLGKTHAAQAMRATALGLASQFPDDQAARLCAKLRRRLATQ